MELVPILLVAMSILMIVAVLMVLVPILIVSIPIRTMVVDDDSRNCIIAAVNVFSEVAIPSVHT